MADLGRIEELSEVVQDIKDMVVVFLRNQRLEGTSESNSPA